MKQPNHCAVICCADSGVKVFANKSGCCAPVTGAFSEGCSNSTPPVPCWVVDSYYPNRSCRRSSDVAVCNRGEHGPSCVTLNDSRVELVY